MDERNDYPRLMPNGMQGLNETHDINLKKWRHQTENTGCPEHLSPIFKLNLDCFFSIFDWLSLSDLIAVASTCKRLQQITGKFYQINYQAKSARAENDGIYLSRIPANIFSEYIRKISISGDRLAAYRHIGLNCGESIKQIRVYGALTPLEFQHIKKILHGVEALEFNDCNIMDEFYANYLKLCPNLKSLSVSRSSKFRDRATVIGTTNEWLLQSYPAMEHFELTELHDLQLNELKVFFEQNLNIRTFSTDAKSLWINRELLKQTKAKFDVFAINICLSKIVDTDNRLITLKDSIYQLLVEFYNCGFYERLHLYVYFVEQPDIDLLLSLSAIEMLNGDVVRVDRPLHNVKASCVCYPDEILNINCLPNNLLNLERIYFFEITFDRILPLIYGLAKLKVIKISQLKNRHEFGKMNLRALNERRRQLQGAKKLRIYVKEDLFLATKWNENTINYDLFELKRFEGFEWTELCARAKYFKTF